MYLLSYKGSYNSARLLATKLGLKVTSSVEKLGGKAPTIRYGNSSGEFTEDTNYNSCAAIRLCGNSVLFSEWAKENGVRTPLYTKFDPSTEYPFPFLLRKERHKGGKDIILIEGPEDLEGKEFLGYYHVPFIHTDSEIGVHVALGNVLRIFRKVPTNDAHPFIRGNKLGYRYSLVKDIVNNYQIAQKLVLEAFEKAGLAFGRADIAYNEAKKTYYIWEINTAPGLNNNTAELYATNLRAVIDVSR